MPNMFIGNVSLSNLLANVPGVQGGRRTLQAVAALAKAIERRDSQEGLPFITSSNVGVRLGATQTLQLVGENFHIATYKHPVQAQEEIVVWGTVVSGNYVKVRARVPGNHGVLLTIAAAGTGAAADTYGAAPAVAWTPETGDIDASITALNAASKLIYATKVGTGGTIATLAQTALSGGAGCGVSLHMGDKLIQNTKTSVFGAAAPGTAAGSFISKWESDLIEVYIHNTDTGVGHAIPTGRTAMTAAGANLLMRAGWPDAHYVAGFPAHVIA